MTNEIVLSSDFPNARAGLNDTLYIPAAALKSNLDVSGRNLPIAVKITKGGETLKEESAGGFDYRFTAIMKLPTQTQNTDLTKPIR